MRELSPFDPNETPANKLLAALPLSQYQRLAPHFKPVNLSLGQVLYEVGDTVHQVYFLTSGLLSLVLTDNTGHHVEVGLAACEGVAGSNAILTGEPSPFLTLVQGAGAALVIPIEVVREEFQRGGALQTA